MMTDNEWVGMKEECLQGIEQVLLMYGKDDCTVENYIVIEMVKALRAERQKVAEYKEALQTIFNATSECRGLSTYDSIKVNDYAKEALQAVK